MINPFEIEKVVVGVKEALPEIEELGRSLRFDDLGLRLKAVGKAILNRSEGEIGRAMPPPNAAPASGYSRKFDVVIEPGGVRGVQSIGGLQALEDFGIRVGRCIGGSVGAGISAMYTNGMKPFEILQHTKLVTKNASTSPFRWLDGVSIPTLEQLKISPSWLSLEGPWRREVEALHLQPNSRLVIPAEKAGTGEAEVFRGNNYRIPFHKAIAASGADHPFFMPVDGGDGLLTDAVHIRQRLDTFADRQADCFQAPQGRGHQKWAEFQGFDDKKDSIVIHLENPRVEGREVNPMDFTYPHLQELYDIGYRETKHALEKAVEEGRLMLNLPKRLH